MSTLAHSVEVRSVAEGRILEISISGKLNRDDFDDIVPQIDSSVRRYGQVRLLLDFMSFEGITMGALLEDMKFAFSHYHAIFRLAVVGDKNWEQAMTTLCKPFTKAAVTYFDVAEMDLARAWLREGVPSSSLAED